MEGIILRGVFGEKGKCWWEWQVGNLNAGREVNDL
jgi:hypothetical protein